MGTLKYIKNYLQDRDVASITPSSSFLVKRVCRRMDFSEPRILVEYGPGAGVFTKYILKQMTPDDRIILFETNPDFADALQGLAEDPRVTLFNESAAKVKGTLKQAGVEEVDYVLSGIPFSFLDEEVRHALIRDTRSVLKPGGKFLVYQHYNHMDEPLRQYFEQVEKDFELLNLPPIHIHSAIKKQ